MVRDIRLSPTAAHRVTWQKKSKNRSASLRRLSPLPFPAFPAATCRKCSSAARLQPARSVLMTAYAVRGLDINTSYTIYHLLNEQKRKGVAIIYVGEDLDVLIDLCDRVLVLCGGKNNGIVEGRKTSKEEVGLLMTKLRELQQKGGVA